MSSDHFVKSSKDPIRMRTQMLASSVYNYTCEYASLKSSQRKLSEFHSPSGGAAGGGGAQQRETFFSPRGRLHSLLIKQATH